MTVPGSTCCAVACVIGQKLTCFNLGNCFVALFRWSYAVGAWQLMFKTNAGRVMMQDIRRNHVTGPRQFSVPHRAARDHDHVVQAITSGEAHVVTDVRQGDVLMVFSDGAGDNVASAELCRILGEHAQGDDQAVATAVLQYAMRPSAPKPDDISVYVGTAVAAQWPCPPAALLAPSSFPFSSPPFKFLSPRYIAKRRRPVALRSRAFFFLAKEKHMCKQTYLIQKSDICDRYSFSLPRDLGFLRRNSHSRSPIEKFGPRGPRRGAKICGQA